jgi:hypothetical protein
MVAYLMPGSASPARISDNPFEKAVIRFLALVLNRSFLCTPGKGGFIVVILFLSSL